ncbi:ATP-binding protein [Sunxiuqinia sp. A32]|uniref:ATP-binding protein n=1 Tax=Sunxiuqinia sp. A32 TaxID=3461496 RepID=UPI004045E033
MSLIKKLTARYLKYIFGSSETHQFEGRVIMATCLIISISGLVIAITNFLLGIDVVMIYVSLMMLLIFGLFYYWARFWGVSTLLYYLISFLGIVILNFSWYFNYGSRGPILAVFIILGAFFVFIWDKRRVILVSSILFLNILTLLFIELNNPDVVGHYPSELTRVADVYIGLFITIILIMAFSIILKQTYLKEYQRARKADMLKSAFIANMSHEIRTPLNAIIGFSSLLVDEDFDQNKKEDFNRHIETNSNYLLGLIEDIIDLSKIEVDEMVFKNEKIEIPHMFENLKASFSNILNTEKKESLAINYEFQESCSTVISDSMRLEQVLRNLINNAIKFTHEGMVSFGCRLLDNELTFYVRDTGIGIREQNMEKIFERFTKIDEDSETLSRGAGIGLFLSKQLVRKMGGSIWVDSVYGVGTTFYFTIDRNGIPIEDFQETAG